MKHPLDKFSAVYSFLLFEKDALEKELAHGVSGSEAVALSNKITFLETLMDRAIVRYRGEANATKA
jgi:hypothetical protein